METIEICTNEPFNESETIEGLSTTEFKELLSLGTKDSHFIFDGTLYKQMDGVGIGSPLGPTLAIAFLVYHEKNWLEHCPVEYRPSYYRRYVDDIFVLFNSAEHLKRFYSYLNFHHLNISLTMENEKDNRMSFLDVNIIRESLPFLSTTNQLLAEFIPILIVSYHLVTKSACYIHYYIDVSGFAQIGLSST